MYLGIDLGTSGVKALLIANDQTVIASATAPMTVSRPHPGWSEQAPADWIAATETALDALRRDHAAGLSAVRGIGLSGQMHGATLLDGADEPLRPCILWNDTRSHAQAARLDADPRFRALSGNIVFPGFTAPKLVWVRENEPDIFARVAKVLLPKDYLRLWLSGEHACDMSDAAGTSWLDVGKRAWSGELLDATGMTAAQMPRLVEGTDASGTLRPELAARWGMTGPVIVAGGAGDNAASAIGTGTIAAGEAFVSLGTSGVLFAANERYLPNPESAVHTFCHALPGRWHQMGVILSAAAALDWWAGIARVAPAELMAELGDSLEAPSAVSFLPYLSGERTPHNDADIRGAFIGLSHDHDRALLTRAVLDGVAFALKDCQEALKVAGTQLKAVTAVGGGSRGRLWLKAIATALDLPVVVPAQGETGAALGAARLGLIAATGADPETVCLPPETQATIEPVADLRGAYDEAYGRYRALYCALKA
ncbi:xylulokinase [Breoghania corrubedonensis]|uniref:Xylulose kinase n=1 Tax=Breoghania corrubedonensis TaxID=665038 RepID=A0A2T5VGV4_9HYPH|nr:xylulokinase [Breoghania corrubedonensis]PTW62991.1 xylulokinase [Breoghania corrubedonensis]